MARKPKQTTRSQRPAQPRVRISSTNTVTVEQHNALLDALFDMLAPSVATRRQLLARYDRIMRDLAAFLELSEQQETLNKRLVDGKSTAVPDQRFPLVDGHVQNILTEVMNTLFPARNMYGSTVLEPDTKKIAQAMIAVMNHHAQLFGHYTQFGMAVTDALVFNMAAIEYLWRADAGVRMVRGKTLTEALRMGNEVRRVDPYNLLLDWSASFQHYGFEGQFYAVIEKISDFAALNKIASGSWYGPTDLRKHLRQVTFVNGKATLRDGASLTNTFYARQDSKLGLPTGYASQMSALYRSRPAVRPKSYFVTDCKTSGAAFNLDNWLGNAARDSEASEASANEVIRITARLVPSDWGLSDSRAVEIWNFVVLNGCFIVKAEQQLNGHGVLPLGLCAPNAEVDALNSKSVAEKMVPFQDWISNLYNLHIKNMRKTVNNGMVFYDPKRVKMGEISDPTSGFVPVSVPEDDDTANGRTVQTAVFRLPESTTTGNGINDIPIVEKMMQGIMPTQQLESVAGLQRAVDHQSRTVASAAGRRTFHLARMISDQALAPGMYVMTMNIITNQPSISLPGPHGDMVEINPEAFQDADIKIAISDGLRGVDNVSIANRVENMIRYALQSRRVQTEVDVLEMIAYLLHLEGANFSIEQFRYESPIDALDPEQKQAAFQLYQQAVAQQQQQGQQGGGGNQ